MDLAPIPAEGLGNAARTGLGIGEGVVPEGEGRLGGSGLVFQTLSGLNLRAEPNQDMRSRISEQLGLAENYADNEPYQKRMVQDELSTISGGELELSAEVGERRGNEWNKYAAALNRLRDEQQERMKGLTESIGKRDRRSIVQGYFDLEGEISTRRSQLASDFGIDFPEGEQSEEEAALDGYFALIDEAKDQAGNFWYDDYTQLRDQYVNQLSTEQRSYILRNTNLVDVPRPLLDFLRFQARSEAARITASEQARATHLRSLGLTALVDK